MQSENENQSIKICWLQINGILYEIGMTAMHVMSLLTIKTCMLCTMYII